MMRRLRVGSEGWDLWLVSFGFMAIQAVYLHCAWRNLVIEVAVVTLKEERSYDPQKRKHP